jgi:predicted N-acyltransferase
MVAAGIQLRPLHKEHSMQRDDYVIRLSTHPRDVDAKSWDALLRLQEQPTPFMRHAYLAALHESGSACPETGWIPHFLTLHAGPALVAACVVYLKTHSHGEYVFDWAWASAYQQHGVAYYPKAVVAVPFTPVPGTRLLARDTDARIALLRELLAWGKRVGVSSIHLLFSTDEDTFASKQLGMMQRNTVQFHWTNTQPALTSFETFLGTLTQEKRKKIRQERRKVADAGVSFQYAKGTEITPAQWEFFYRCYEKTYWEHGNPPYLSRDFFARMASTMPEHWLLFIAYREQQPIASSLIAIDEVSTGDTMDFNPPMKKIAYGRYWGALERVDCLHFEACFYQPLQWCIENAYDRFEGGAQGEHKMARALLPVKTNSAHWIAHPAFADAVARFLEREGQGIGNYLQDLQERIPFKQTL